MDEDVNIIPVEEIPDQDRVARQIERPYSYHDLDKVLWDNAFQFARGQGESVSWDKYAPNAVDIHAIGKAREAQKRANGKIITYMGYVNCTSVGGIRELRSPNGHGFIVTHEPAEGIYHCEIRFFIAGGGPYTDLKTSEKADLKVSLHRCFGELVPCDT